MNTSNDTCHLSYIPKKSICLAYIVRDNYGSLGHVCLYTTYEARCTEVYRPIQWNKETTHTNYPPSTVFLNSILGVYPIVQKNKGIPSTNWWLIFAN